MTSHPLAGEFNCLGGIKRVAFYSKYLYKVTVQGDRNIVSAIKKRSPRSQH